MFTPRLPESDSESDARNREDVERSVLRVPVCSYPKVEPCNDQSYFAGSLIRQRIVWHLLLPRYFESESLLRNEFKDPRPNDFVPPVLFREKSFFSQVEEY